MTLSRLLLACSALTLCGVAQASTPVQVSLPGVNLPASHQVEGARASFLYGRTGQVKGIDLPVFALSDVDQFSGLQLGVFLGAGRVRHQFGGVAINAINMIKDFMAAKKLIAEGLASGPPAPLPPDHFDKLRERARNRK